MLGNIGMPELVVIFVIALVVFGPRRLPDLGRSLGRAITEIKRATHELPARLEQEISREVEEEGRRATPPPPRAAAAAGHHAGDNSEPRSSQATERASSPD